MNSINTKILNHEVSRIILSLVLLVSAMQQKSNIVIIGFLALYFSLKKNSDLFLVVLYKKFLLLFFFVGISFVFPINNTQRALIGIIAIIFLILFSKKWVLSVDRAFGFGYVFLFTQIMYFIVTSFEERALQFLLYGYDNAFHYSLFRIYLYSEQFPNGLNLDWPSDFSLFRNYSGGFYAISTFLTKALIGDVNNSTNVIAAYFLILILLFIGIWWFSISIVRTISKANYSKLPTFGISLAAISSTGVLLTNGYPPYLFGLLILVLSVGILIKERDYGYLVLWTALPFHIILISQPLVSWNLLTIILFLGAIFISKNNLVEFLKQYFSYMILSILLVVLAILITQDTAKNFGTSTLVAVGGVQPLTYTYWFIMLSLSLLTILLTVLMREFIFLIIVISVSAPFVFLVGLTFLKTGSVGYYAIKQGYIWAYVISFTSALIYQRARWEKCEYKSNTINLLARVMIFFLLAGSVYGINASRVFNGPFMGNLRNVVVATIGPESNWSLTGLDAKQLKLASIIGQNSHKGCLIYKPGANFSDLGSRWLNTLSLKEVTENCFAVYWNSDSLSDNEMKMRIRELKLKVQIISVPVVTTS